MFFDDARTCVLRLRWCWAERGFLRSSLFYFHTCLISHDQPSEFARDEGKGCLLLDPVFTKFQRHHQHYRLVKGAHGSTTFTVACTFLFHAFSVRPQCSVVLSDRSITFTVCTNSFASSLPINKHTLVFFVSRHAGDTPYRSQAFLPTDHIVLLSSYARLSFNGNSMKFSSKCRSRRAVSCNSCASAVLRTCAWPHKCY